MRHAALVTELEASVGENAVRVVLLSAHRGAGLTHTLAALAEEVRGRGLFAVVTDAEHVSVDAGGALEALLRARLGLRAAERGEAVLGALDGATPDLEPQARELLAFALGTSRADFHTARLDAKSRWEGALAEVGRWLVARGGPWAWLIDEAAALDGESMQLVTWLGLAAQTPGLVVLAVRDEERPVLEGRLASLRAAGRVKDLALPPLDAGALAAAFPETAGSARGLPLLARLLAATGQAGGKGATVDGAARELVARLTDGERDVLGVLQVAGGRLPAGALAAVLGPVDAALASLAGKGLVGRGATRRSGDDDEAWVRFPGAVPRAGEAAARWLAALGRWAEGVLLAAKDLEPLRSLVLPQIIRAAEAAGDLGRVSLAWELTARGGQTSYALQKAEAASQGVRRLVLARRLAEDEVFRGDVQKALATVHAALRLPPGGAESLPVTWLPLLARELGDELERWHELTADEALVALELVRAEALSQLAQTNETRRAFEAVELRLGRLKPSVAASALWLRLARTWAWFAAELVGDGALARRVCETARAKAGPEALRTSGHALSFVRAEQVAQSHGGDEVRARALADELIELSRARGDVREECVAWNARSLLHLRDGDLMKARLGFERSLTLARAIGFRRREAVALHNLGLTLAAAGEYGASLACQEKYLALSEQIGNFVARACGPAAMALVYVQQVDQAKAEPLLQRARRAAEDHDWLTLVAWTRHLQGLLKLLRHVQRKDTLVLSQSRADFLACLDLLEDRKAGWAEELDPAEVACCLALTWHAVGNHAQARAAAQKAERYENGSACSRAHVAALRDVLDGQPPTAALEWFEERGQLRAADLWRRVSASLGLADGGRF